jgi:hypothetical protein
MSAATAGLALAWIGRQSRATPRHLPKGPDHPLLHRLNCQGGNGRACRIVRHGLEGQPLGIDQAGAAGHRVDGRRGRGDTVVLLRPRSAPSRGAVDR